MKKEREVSPLALCSTRPHTVDYMGACVQEEGEFGRPSDPVQVLGNLKGASGTVGGADSGNIPHILPQSCQLSAHSVKTSKCPALLDCRSERCPLRPKWRVTRLKAKVEPLLT